MKGGRNVEHIDKNEARNVVRTAFQLILRRDVDSDGLRYFTEELISGRMGVAALYAALTSSDEFAALAAAHAEALPPEGGTRIVEYFDEIEARRTVRTAFQLILRREVNKKDLKYFAEELISGRMSAAALYAHITASDEFAFFASHPEKLPPVPLEPIVGLILALTHPDPEFVVDMSSGDFGRRERQVLAANRRVLRSLEWMVIRAHGEADDEGVLNAAHAVGEWAAMHHGGVFASPLVERALIEAGSRMTSALPGWQRTERRSNVLHVMTVATEIGGHNHLLREWVATDSWRQHSAVITESSDAHATDRLAVTTEGRVSILRGSTRAERVIELARMAQDFDLILLYIHPWDSVAVAALGDPARRPPTVLVDVNDHMFWLGVGVADVVVEHRPSGTQVALERRGIEAPRLAELPHPIEMLERSKSRSAAKTALGLNEDVVVLLTIASAHKFADVGSDSFFSLVRAVLIRSPQAVLLAVGPDASSPNWAALAGEFGPRIRVLSPTPEVALFREAADVYLDSFPLGSPTSLFEAALYGAPVVCYRPAGSGVMTPEDPDAQLIDAVEPAEWIETVVRLIEDADFRVREGSRLAKEIREAHGPDQVRPRMIALFRDANYGRAKVPDSVPEYATLLDLRLVAYQEASKVGTSFEHVLTVHGLLTGHG